ncbi:DEAD/DEAH box helicase [Herbaspirillum sp. SJZ107]|uniref:DEAD/DEAH box helicase n=1 Tax=Herbaspirillum sp. SJZ107 TaxID=2572881 RepID=UPI00116A9361|nr:DEAD/DEAH box helicase [Herbaspirillum sp. SJZ107]TQK03439.1 helicase-like protein [Herbaspirillum sp. SJZ107]
MDAFARDVNAYLLQLEEEGFVTRLADDWLLPWDQMYEILDAPEHETSIPLLTLPEQSDLRPVLSSSASLADLDFRVIVSGWETRDGVPVRDGLARTGATFIAGGQRFRFPAPVWKLIRAVVELGRNQKVDPGESTNQLGWATVRQLARKAHARMDGFLERTVVVRPETLRMEMTRRLIGDEQVIEISPVFDEQPEGWLTSFDRLHQVQDRYIIASPNGGVTHVLIPPNVRSVLEEVHAMPGRRVAGDKANLFLQNPFALLGPEAVDVLDPDEYDRSLQVAGIHFYSFAVQPQLHEDGAIRTVTLVLTAPSEDTTPVELDLVDPVTMGRFVHEMGSKLLADLPCACWKGYELDMAGFGQRDLSDLESLQQRWTQELAGRAFDTTLDLSEYGDRVIGIGPAEKVTSSFLQKTRSETWLPVETLRELGLDGELLGKWDTSSLEDFERFTANIEDARETGAATARLPGPELDLDLLTAQRLAQAWEGKLKPEARRREGVPEERTVLLVEGNIDELNYRHKRREILRRGLAANAHLPLALLPETTLREHQLKGVGWLQHQYALCPDVTSGCLLADDMGLGKTLQLLTFIAWCMEREPEGPPILIVAPVSLLDNWEREMRNFLHPKIADDVFRLYGRATMEARMPPSDIPAALRANGICNLLRFGWRQNRRIVLTTYETLRDQEFSLARQDWAVVICDEAQKIKNPAARVTQATKALKARFRIACTGTPVENSLTDLWCLYDWIQPGLLGSLSEFGKKFRRPIETEENASEEALAELRLLIEPQLLRRTKADVAKDLPAKIEDTGCKTLVMSSLQQTLYRAQLAAYEQQRSLQEALGSGGAAMLGLLHRLKLVCSHPHAIRPEGDPLTASPKLRWLMHKLQDIRGRGEKAIIFTELRDIQRMLRFAIQDEFGFSPDVINGDTNSTSERGPGRQNLIDRFQQKPGFGVIILSTTAVGFGVNIQKANHVIHFTRPWNPAKEDQATDRAYRIGQERDVFVYYPTVVGNGMTTFDQILDGLLSRKRTLAGDMLKASTDIDINEFMLAIN